MSKTGETTSPSVLAMGTVRGTAAATNVGNDVAGSGTGFAQSLTAYATLPSANYTPTGTATR